MADQHHGSDPGEHAQGTLRPEHLEFLKVRGISDDVIRARGYYSVANRTELRAVGCFPESHVRKLNTPGLVIRLWAPDGSQPLSQYRPDVPRLDGKQRPRKYEIPYGRGLRIDVSPACRELLADPEVPAIFTEGIPKDDAIASAGGCGIGLLGVYGYKGKNDFGAVALSADLASIPLKCGRQGRQAFLAFDSDWGTNPLVRRALEEFGEILQRKGAHVTALYIPHGQGGAKQGVDDYLADGHTLADLLALGTPIRPEAKPAPPTIRILDTAPVTLARPLDILGDHAFAATWPYVEVTTRERQERDGTIVKLAEPEVARRQVLIVVRDDGQMFGDLKSEQVGALAEAGIASAQLPEAPRDRHLWRPQGMRPYIEGGRRPDPAEVFGRMVAVVERFIDFHKSLADQRTTVELVACFALSTWYLAAVDVVGYLWLTGDKGAGKSHVLQVIAELSFLGTVILSSSTFPTIRDMAAYGATLCFDDAEAVTKLDSKAVDADSKRELLLAGNRRGAECSYREPGEGGQGWHTRWVNAFCPRAFSAIRIPDDVLASRSILVPMLRSSNTDKTNYDPGNHKLWPCNRQSLIDDLWALALAHQLSMRDHVEPAMTQARLSGRSLEPWLATLTVAHWLDAQDPAGSLRREITRPKRHPQTLLPIVDGNGQPQTERVLAGLYERLEELSVSYQEERSDLIGHSDFSAQVLQAIIRHLRFDCLDRHLDDCDNCDKSDNCDNQDLRATIGVADRLWCFTTKQIVLALGLSQTEDGDEEPPSADAGDEAANHDEAQRKRRLSQRVGMVLRRLRLTKPPRQAAVRRWQITWDELTRLCRSYGVPCPHYPREAVTVDTVDTVDTPAQADLFADHPVSEEDSAPPPCARLGDTCPSCGREDAIREMTTGLPYCMYCSEEFTPLPDDRGETTGSGEAAR